MKIIIAGGGIGGLATAIALRKLGIEPVVLERKAEAGEAGAGLGLYPNAMKVMSYLGTDAYFRNAAIDSQETENRVLETDELIVLRRSARVAALFGDKAYTAHRGDLHTALLQAVPQDLMRLDARVVGFEETATGVIAKLDNGDTVEGDALIGADGLRSTIRTCLFGEQEARFTGIVTWRCLIPADRIAVRYHDRHTVWFGNNRHAMLYGVRKDLYCLNAFVPAGEVHAESWNVMGDVSQLPDLYPGACPALHDILTSVESALVTPIYFRDPLEEWGRGRVTLLGDAAHPAPPSAGQGAAMALEDAVTLAHALHRRPDDIPAALLDYAERRKARTRRMLLASRVMLRISSEGDATQRQARNTWLRGIEQLDPGNLSVIGWLWEYDPIAVAMAPEPPPAAKPLPNPLKRPEARHIYDLLRGAITLEERARQWLGERVGYARFLEQNCPAPSDIKVEAVDCDGVPGLWVTPSSGAYADTIVFHLHGGGYRLGSAEGSVRLAAQLAEAVGGQTLTIDYRLAPEHPFPAGLDDVRAAWDWLVRRHPTARIILSGECSGGGLALALATKLRDAGERLPDLLHLASPFADLSLSGAEVAERAVIEPLLTHEFLRGLAGGYIGETDMKRPDVSPLFADMAGLPPMLIEAAANEALVDDAKRIATAAEQAGVPVTLTLAEDSVHSFILFDTLPETQEALARLTEAAALKEPAPVG